MTLPEGITAATVTVGVAMTVAGTPVKTHITLEASAPLIHVATGTPLVEVLEDVTLAAGASGSFTLPHTDQAGFEDGAGNAYTDWYYTARITYGERIKGKTQPARTKIFQIPTGQDVVDLDLLPSGAAAEPWSAPAAAVSSFEGRTGPVTLLETDLPDRLSETELSATYATRPVKPAVDFSPLPGLLRGEYNYNAVPFIQDNLCTFGNTQYAVYWGTDQAGYITKRTLPDGPWSTPVNLQTVTGNPLQTPVTDDGHNSLCVAVDPTGNVHVSGNHHGNPLRYMHTTTPGDLSTFVGATITGVNEDNVTYPQFFANEAGTLFLIFRNGGSGNGNEYIRRLDSMAGGVSTWVNPVAGALIDGISAAENPYMQHVSVDANGIHLFWCWRDDSTDAASNTDMTYMRGSQNGATWTTETGAPVTIPMTHAAGNVIWNTAYGSGMVNQNGATVDSLGRPHTVFHEYDVDGKTQIAHVWFDGTAWQHELVTKYLTRRMETVAQGLIAVEISRPTIVAAKDGGKVYVIFRTLYDNRRGTVRCVDATPGTTDRRDWSICDIDLWEWEPTFDTQAAKNRNELHMLIHPSLNNAQASPGYSSANNWRRQYGAVLTIDLGQMAAVRGGLVRLPAMRVLTCAVPTISNLVLTNTADADVALGSLLAPKDLPRQKGKVLFARWRARANTVNASGNTGRFRVKLTDGNYVHVAGDLLWTTSTSKLQETPWLPFPEWPLNDTLSWITINGSTDNAAGTRFTIVEMELGYIDF